MEVQTGAEAPVLGFHEVLVTLHLGADADAELLQDVHRDEQVGNAAGVVHIDRGFSLGQGQGGQKAGDELRASFSGNIGPSGDEGAGDLQGEVAVGLAVLANSFVTLRIEADSVGGHDVMGIGQRAVQQGFFAGDPYAAGRKRGQQRDHHAGQEAGFSGVDFFQIQAAGRSADTRYNDSVTINRNLRSKGFGGRNGAFVVSAGGIAVQVGSSLGQGGGDDGPLGEALGRRHRQVLGRNEAEIAIHFARHFLRGPLAGGRGFLGADARVGEGCAALQGFQAGGSALLAHREGDERTGFGSVVEGEDGVGIGLGGGGRHHLHHFSAEAARALHQGEQHLAGRGAVEVVVGADEHGAVFLAGLADAAADGCGCLHLQVHVLGAGLDGPLEDLGGLGLFAQAAGGDEGDVGLAEEGVDVLVLQGAAVQADLGHLQVLQQGLDVGEFLILYRSADHRGSFHGKPLPRA